MSLLIEEPAPVGGWNMETQVDDSPLLMSADLMTGAPEETLEETLGELMTEEGTLTIEDSAPAAEPVLGDDTAEVSSN